MTGVNRREFLRLASAGTAGAIATTALPSALGLRDDQRFGQQAIAEAVHLPRPRPAQLAWQQAELGVVFHYDLHVFDGKRYSQPYNRRNPITDPNVFNPDKYDVDQWISAAKAAGARFAILTASHETGFRLWQSDANPYCMKAIRWRDGGGDPVRDFIEACRGQGIKPGVYLGARWNSHLGVLNFRVTDRSPLSQEQYNRLIEREVEEICARYGELFELWFDGGILAPQDGGPDVLPIFEKHQPNCLFYHSDQRRDARWGGTESGTVPHPCWATADLEQLKNRKWGREFQQYLMHGDPNGPHWCPAMSDAPLRGTNGRHEWFWEPDDEHAIYTLDKLADMYERSVGRNSTLILGLTPDPHGLIPGADTRRLAEWGRAIRDRCGRPLAQMHAIGSELVLELPRPARIDRVVIQEDIEHGQRTRRYELHGLVAGNTWHKLGEGTCIGHKRIQSFDAVEVSRVRLAVAQAVAAPAIKNFAVYEVRA